MHLEMKCVYTCADHSVLLSNIIEATQTAGTANAGGPKQHLIVYRGGTGEY
jgi:hypothetical protein